MRQVPIIILSILLSACGHHNIYFDKEYYEKATRIRLPENYTVLETFDNGEWVTGTVFKMDSLSLQGFIIANHFDTLTDYRDTHMMSESFLSEYKPLFSPTAHLYIIRKSDNKINWTYIADLTNKRLWAEISYPDWGGK